MRSTLPVTLTASILRPGPRDASSHRRRHRRADHGAAAPRTARPRSGACLRAVLEGQERPQGPSRRQECRVPRFNAWGGPPGWVGRGDRFADVAGSPSKARRGVPRGGLPRSRSGPASAINSVSRDADHSPTDRPDTVCGGWAPILLYQKRHGTLFVIESVDAKTSACQRRRHEVTAERANRGRRRHGPACAPDGRKEETGSCQQDPRA